METRTKEQIKAERNERARLAVAEYQKTDSFKKWKEENKDRLRQQRKKRKEEYRRVAGAIPRTVLKERARIKKEKDEERRKENLIKKQLGLFWCDAHIERFNKLKKSREYYAKRYAQNPEKERQRQKNAKANLKNAYIRQQLKSMGIQYECMTPELIELKREQLALRRLSREAEQAVVKQLEN